MMRIQTTLACIVAAVLCQVAVAADYRSEPLNEGPPVEELAAEIAKQLTPTGVRVIRGSSTTFCDIWLCDELTVRSGFEPTPQVRYPFAPGQLLGVVRFRRRGADFRDQRINRGVYTMRYAHQPVDGAHVGTSLTRDFVLLVQADQDESAKDLDYESLVADSTEAAGTSHPCLLSLQRVVGERKHGEMRHDEERDLWIVALLGGESGASSGSVPIELVVVGAAEE